MLHADPEAGPGACVLSVKAHEAVARSAAVPDLGPPQAHLVLSRCGAGVGGPSNQPAGKVMLESEC